MLKKVIPVILAGCCIATPSFAFDPLQAFKITRNEHKTISTPKATSSEPQSYTDFSGTWTGTCFIDGSSEANIITIANEEHHIWFNKKHYSLRGYLKSESDSEPDYALHAHQSLFWNADKSQITSNTISVNKIYPDSTYTSIQEVVFSINNQQLIIEGKSIEFFGAEQVKESSINCVYTKEG